MKLKALTKVRTKEEAIQIAAEWQRQAGRQTLSYGELAEHQNYFQSLAEKFNLTEEYNENGII